MIHLARQNTDSTNWTTWCKITGPGITMIHEGTEVDCPACIFAWENIPRTVTNIELAEALNAVYEALIPIVPVRVGERSTIFKLKEKLLTPTRKWPFPTKSVTPIE